MVGLPRRGAEGAVSTADVARRSSTTEGAGHSLQVDVAAGAAEQRSQGDHRLLRASHWGLSDLYQAAQAGGPAGAEQAAAKPAADDNVVDAEVKEVKKG